MRVLCLHDHSSSAKHLHATLHCLGERLWNRHDIELVFVNAPLVYQSPPVSVKNGDSQNLSLMKHLQELNIASPAKKKSCKSNATNDSMMTTNNNGGDDVTTDTTETKLTKARIRDKANMNENCRCWWEDSTNNGNIHPCNNHNNENDRNQPQLIGLDASILQLQQLWSSLPPSSTATDSTFVGILGIGQGAALASIVSLLSSSELFDGLEFAIFIKGFDLLQQQKHPSSSSSSVWFEGEPPIHTLHVMSSSSSTSEHNLYECFGGDSYPKRNQRYYLGSKNSNNTRTKNTRCKRRLPKVSTKHTINVQDLNIMGRFIVERKKEWQFHRQKRQSIIIPTAATITTNNVSLSSTEESYSKRNISIDKENDTPFQQNNNSLDQATEKHNYTKIVSLEETKQKIDALERYALESVLPVGIRSNPPKSLIASIFRPSLKGAWMGGHKDVDRSKDFTESGGAPYPSSTIIRPSVIRPKQEDISSSNDAVMKS